MLISDTSVRPDLLWPNAIFLAFIVYMSVLIPRRISAVILLTCCHSPPLWALLSPPFVLPLVLDVCTTL